MASTSVRLSAPMSPSFHPTEHRGYRELYVSLRQLAEHWQRLGGRLAGERVGSELVAGAAAARALLHALSAFTEPRGLYGRPLATGLGGVIAAARNLAGVRLLERNQAVRLALLDVHHARELLDYLARAAEHRGDTDAVAFCNSARKRLGKAKDRVRGAYLQMAADPDRAIKPAERSLAGWVASRLGVATGTLGELVDRRAGRR